MAKRIGIVGHEAKKFDKDTERRAKELIAQILVQEAHEDITLVSGGCHLGGIDIWAEEVADTLGIPKLIHLPKVRSWSEGYKPRNIRIAQDSDILHNIVVAEYPEGYSGMRFDYCYHCDSTDHIKSGGCWTMRYAEKRGKETKLWVL